MAIERIKFDGLAELEKKLKSLSQEVEKKIAYKATLAGAIVVRNEAKRIAKAKGLVKTGALINNIAVAREKTARGRAEYHVGVRHGRGSKKRVGKIRRTGRFSYKIVYNNNPYYFWFHERELGVPSKNIPSRPFLRPAFDSKRVEAVEKMRDTIKKNLLKYGLKP